MKESINPTEPPCISCMAHDELEKRMGVSDKLNSTQHNEILNSVDIIIGNIKWMNIIGKWVLATMLGYFVGIAIFIFNNDYATHNDIDKIEKTIKDGEILHYQNEKTISSIETKLDILTDFTRRNNK